MVNNDIFNAAWKSESQISSYEQDTLIENLWFVNKVRVLLFFTFVLYWYTYIFT